MGEEEIGRIEIAGMCATTAAASLSFFGLRTWYNVGQAVGEWTPILLALDDGVSCEASRASSPCFCTAVMSPAVSVASFLSGTLY